MTTNSKKLENLKNIFWCFVFAIVVAGLCYAYLVNKTVYNVAERERIESKKAQINSSLSELEFKSIAMKNEINPEYARSLGFQDVKKQEFILASKERVAVSSRSVLEEDKI